MPGTVQPGSISNFVISSLDLFPSFTKMAGGKVPPNTVYDGIDSSDALLGQIETESQRPQHLDRLIFYYCNSHLLAVRYGSYKFHYKT